eukprot:m.245125 g.245125  ORF g.245125 m.245125 type:complete len:336 (-) comp15359_c0_seq2:1111-2118(-)
MSYRDRDRRDYSSRGDRDRYRGDRSDRGGRKEGGGGIREADIERLERRRTQRESLWKDTSRSAWGPSPSPTPRTPTPPSSPEDRRSAKRTHSRHSDSRSESDSDSVSPHRKRDKASSKHKKSKKGHRERSERKAKKKKDKHKRKHKHSSRSHRRRHYSSDEEDEEVEVTAAQLALKAQQGNAPPTAAASAGDADADPADGSSSEDDVIGPAAPKALRKLQGRDFGGALLAGEGDAMAAFIAEGKRIPRRGEIGLTPDEITNYEDDGYVMSGSRHRRMEAVRQRKENQVYDAQQKRELAIANEEQRQKRENSMISEWRDMLAKRQGQIERKMIQEF